MRVLLVETTQYYPSSPLFLEALTEIARECGYDYEFLDEGEFLKPLSVSLVHKLAYWLLGRRPLTYWALNQALLEKARHFRPDVVLVVKGAYISPATLRRIKGDTGASLVNFATDDPFNPAVNTRNLIVSIPLYDLYACQKRAIMDDIRNAGCRSVIYVPVGYKPSFHFPERPATPEEKTHFTSDVVFIGGCDQDRTPYFERLVQAIPDVRLHLYGGYWDRHPILGRYHYGFSLGRSYRLALGGAKIAINLVRRANRDGHVMRTFEIPACGAFMLAERTEEHLELFEEDKEAAYFGSPEELIEKVHYYLAHDDERECIAEAGHRRIINGANTYRDRLLQILRVIEPSV